MRQISPKKGVLASALIAAFTAGAAGASTIAVDGSVCTLGQAILAANTDLAVGGCSAGLGIDTLVLGADLVLSAPVTSAIEGGPSGLPEVSSTIEIAAGAGSRIERQLDLPCGSAEPSAFRLLTVAAGGDLTLNGLSLRNGCVAPAEASAIASGGAVLVLPGGALEIVDCDLSANVARGGPEGVEPAGAARGGAVAVLGGTLAIAGSLFSENEAAGFDGRGGAVAVEAGTVDAIEGSRFEGNRATPAPAGTFLANANSGGAIALRDAAAGSLAHLVLSSNRAGRADAVSLVGGPARGGGLDVTGGRVREIRDLYFVSNVARAGGGSSLLATEGAGGGIANSGAIDSIARATFSSNQALGASGGAGRGGGLDNSGEIGKISTSSFLGNGAAGGAGLFLSQGASLGGGLANRGTVGEIVASSFVGNACAESVFASVSAGGGIYNATDDVAPEGGLAIVESLLADNLATTGADCASTAPFTSLGFNLAEAPEATCTFAGVGDLIGVDPLALPPDDHGCTVPLPGAICAPAVSFATGSAALDAGLCASPGSEVDVRGAVRPHDLAGVPNAPGGDGCDIGALEDGATLADVHVGLSISDSVDPVVSGTGAGNLEYTIGLANLGSATSTGVVVAAALPLPSGVTLDSVEASAGSWDGTAWTIPTLASGASASLTFVLTIGFDTSGGPDVLAISAEVTAAAGHEGEFESDAESTSVIEGVFFDGFESSDTSAWSQTLGN